MEYLKLLKILLTSVGSLLTLFLLAKLVGNKQLSEMSFFDYIISISVGSIAAELATELEEPLYPFTALVVYGLLAFLIAVLCNKSLKFRTLISGKPLVLLDRGRLLKKNMARARMDLEELLGAARKAGYYTLDDLETAVLECNGAVSFLPKSAVRPLTPEDAGLYLKQQRMPTNLIMDGELLKDNLKSLGRSEQWLKGELKKQGFHSYKPVFLAFLNDDNSLSVYKSS